LLDVFAIQHVRENSHVDYFWFTFRRGIDPRLKFRTSFHLRKNFLLVFGHI